MTHTITPNSNRLASLDILRGFDLFMLLFLQPVLVSVSRVYSAPWFDSVMYQLDHEPWEGFRCWDLVMPLFLFMVGAAMPFSFAKYRTDKGARGDVYKRIARRVALLFLFGMIVQGNLLGFDFGHLYLYSNTLQAIAMGYLISAIILLNCSVRMQVVWTFLLMVIYSVPMALFGDWSVEGNFAYIVDQSIYGRFHGDPAYTWLWSSLTFGSTVMFGALAGQLMRNTRRLPRTRIAALLAAGAIALIALGLLLSLVEPIIKHIWTSSMTLYASGLCMLLMALTYWWVDAMGHSRGLNWLKIYGMNPITAYILGEVINFRSIVHSVSYGLQPHLADWYPVWLTFGNFFILFLLLRFMYKHKIFLKI
ncbi:MAG: DUF5009 domain-containing protein [Muribaculaceae bacterium]|nr:DUF5009 domain-containing protein [Muribaculaceae bacterium]